MYKNILIAILLVVNVTSVYAKKDDVSYVIYGDSINKQEAIETKNLLLKEYKNLVKGLDDICVEDVLVDYLNLENVTYKNNQIIIIVGDGLGTKLTGKLKTNYCEVDRDEIETEFFFKKLWKSVAS